MIPKGVKRLTISKGETCSFLTTGLAVAGDLSFYHLLAIVTLQKFTGKEIRDGILRSFNILNIKIKKTLKIACHLAKICLEAIFSTSFSITYLDMQQKLLV